jgi:hypothetical protein
MSTMLLELLSAPFAKNFNSGARAFFLSSIGLIDTAPTLYKALFCRFSSFGLPLPPLFRLFLDYERQSIISPMLIIDLMPSMSLSTEATSSKGFFFFFKYL